MKTTEKSSSRESLNLYPKNKADILRYVKSEGIRFINLWFVDILGQLKSFSISDRELEGALEEGMGFDGSSIEGFARIYESDLIAKPDPSTFTVLPWRPQDDAVARMFVDIYYPDGKPYDGDTRYALKRMLRKVADMGYTYYVGPELEYFYFKNEKSTETLDEGGYFDNLPLDLARDFRRDTILSLEKLGIQVEYSHHEVAPSQHEIDLRYNNALQMADDVMTYKVAVKQIAWSKGVYASFMPKPIEGVNGSGMHTHQSLFHGSRNAFFDPKDKTHLSEIAKHYIAGVMKYVKEFTVITNQWVNSYKRLVPGYEAPVYISWAQKNRSALIRVPMYKPGKEKASRIELRFPDPACNPYLAFTVMLAAGLEGIKQKLKMPAPVEKDIFHMTPEERKREDIDSLPGSLIEALEYAEKSAFLKGVLGDHIFEKFVENKKIEWGNYSLHITKYELDKYLPIL